jgi:sodium/proline symporter
MSTADSQLLAASSAVSQNILQDCFKIKVSKKTSMTTARITVIVIAVLSIILASNPDSSVFEIVSFAWAGFGATFGPVILAALFWRRANKYGVMAGMVSGGVMIFLWKYVIADLGGVFAIYELLPAFLVAIIAIVVVSLVTGEPDKKVLEKFDKVRV